MQSSRWCIGYDRAANDARPRWINARRPADLVAGNPMMVTAQGAQIRSGCALYIDRMCMM